MELFHYTDVANKESVLKNGLKATTKYEIFTPIRENVVFCWLKKEDNKIFDSSRICFRVNVSDDRCLIADMDYISIAMMYKYNTQGEGMVKKPVNKNAEALLVQLYEVTAVKYCDYYDGIHFSPEVLVKGDIQATDIEIYH
ncbi:MAG: hypothetical protein FWC95_06480 [Defluviitaleaceae bacterium]|nr:hypothetical protein [Defluviitaleaceae bacterium]